MPTKSQKKWLLLGFSLILPYLCYLYFNHTYVFVVPCRYYALAATGPLHILFPHSKDSFLSILPFNLFFTLQNSIISPDKPCLTILTRLNFCSSDVIAYSCPPLTHEKILFFNQNDDKIYHCFWIALCRWESLVPMPIMKEPALETLVTLSVAPGSTASASLEAQ